MTLGGGSGTIPPPPPPRGARGIVTKPKSSDRDEGPERSTAATVAAKPQPSTPPGSDEEELDVVNPLGQMTGTNNFGSETPMVAQFSYEAAEDGELSFDVGDVVVVTAEDESGWGMGHVQGRPEAEGVFPLNYLSVAVKGTRL